MILTPQIDGSAAIRSSPADFVQALRQRVAAGLLTGSPHPRSNYRVVESGPAHVRVQAVDWWTAINVGLNDVDLRFPEEGAIAYRVRYWRWAWYAIGLSGVLGLIGALLVTVFDVRGYIASHPSSQVPGLSIDQHVLFIWAMILFWGFVWPWLLIALHKGPLRRLLTRLLGEIDAAARS